MDSSRLAAEVERFDPDLPVERAFAPPSSWYTAPAVHELERRAVLQRRWLYACRAHDVSAPGSYAAGCVAGMPWVVARDAGGTLRAFHNVCRHRGSEVVQGTGAAGDLTCRYHGWVYGLDGRLQRAPRMGRIDGFDRADFALPPLQVFEWGPLVMINADLDARPFLDDFGPLDDRLRATGWGRLLPGPRRVWDVGSNWKVFNDNYLDGGYHIAHMHPTLDAQLDMSTYRTELFGWYSLQTSAPDRTDDPRAQVDVAQRMGEGPVYAWLYPTLMINRYGPVLDINVVLPVAPDRCQVLFDFWFDPAVADDSAFLEQSLAQSDVTQREDIDVSESVQRGTASPTYDRGRYASSWERGIHHFHQLLARDLRAGLRA